MSATQTLHRQSAHTQPRTHASSHRRSNSAAQPSPRPTAPVLTSRQDSANSAIWSTASTVGDARDTRPHQHCSLHKTGRCVCTTGVQSPQIPPAPVPAAVAITSTSHGSPAKGGDDKRVFHYYTLPDGGYREPKATVPDEAKAGDALTRAASRRRMAEKALDKGIAPGPSPLPSPRPSVRRASGTTPVTATSPTLANGTPELRKDESLRRHGSARRRDAVPAPTPSPKPFSGAHEPPKREESLRRTSSTKRKDLSPTRQDLSDNEMPQRPPRTAAPPSLSRRKPLPPVTRDFGAAPSPKPAEPAHLSREGEPPSSATNTKTTKKEKHSSAPLPVVVPPSPMDNEATAPQRSNTVPTKHREQPHRVYNYYTLPGGGYRTPSRPSSDATERDVPAVAAVKQPTYYITHEPAVRGRGRGHVRSGSVPHAGMRPQLGVDTSTAARDPSRSDDEAGGADSGDSAHGRRVPQPRDRSPYPVRAELPTPTTEAPTALETGDHHHHQHQHQQQPSAVSTDDRPESWIPPIARPRGDGDAPPPGILLNRVPVAPRSVHGGFVPPERPSARERWRSRGGRGHARRPSAPVFGPGGDQRDGAASIRSEGAGKRAWVRVVGKVKDMLGRASIHSGGRSAADSMYRMQSR
jgi:hypothetical protein